MAGFVFLSLSFSQNFPKELNVSFVIQSMRLAFVVKFPKIQERKPSKNLSLANVCQLMSFVSCLLTKRKIHNKQLLSKTNLFVYFFG